MPDRSLHHLPAFAWRGRVRENGRVALAEDDLRSAAAAAAAGLGRGALPCFMVGRHPQHLRPCAPQIGDEREAWLMMPADPRRVARVRAVQVSLLETSRPGSRSCLAA